MNVYVCRTKHAVMFCLQLISVSRLCTGSWCNVYQTGVAQRLYDCGKGKHLSLVYVLQIPMAVSDFIFCLCNFR